MEFEYLVSGCPQDRNVSLGIGIGGIVVHSRILVENPNGSSSNAHDFNFGFNALNATGLAVEAPIGSTINLSRTGQQVNLAEDLQCPAPRLVPPLLPSARRS